MSCQTMKNAPMLLRMMVKKTKMKHRKRKMEKLIAMKVKLLLISSRKGRTNRIARYQSSGDMRSVVKSLELLSVLCVSQGTGSNRMTLWMDSKIMLAINTTKCTMSVLGLDAGSLLSATLSLNCTDLKPSTESRFLWKRFLHSEDISMKEVGSQYGITSGSVSQKFLPEGSAKTSNKQVLLVTDEDETKKRDKNRKTLLHANGAQGLGIATRLLPLSQPDKLFNVSTFHADMLGLEGENLAQVLPSTGQRLKDTKDQLRKQLFMECKMRRITFSKVNGISIELIVFPTLPGAVTLLSSVTNAPTEGSFICANTGALILQEPPKCFLTYKGSCLVGSYIFSCSRSSGTQSSRLLNIICQ